MEEKNTKYKKIFIIAGASLVTVAVVVILLIFFVNKGQPTAVQASNTTGEVQTTNQAPSSQKVEKWQEGVITYDGKKYQYNNHIKSYLFLGIDEEGPVEPAKEGEFGGQSDAMFLLVVDDLNQQISVIAINRNTMTDVERYDVDGNYIDLITTQICVQHAFGDGMRQSCLRTVDAVESLFYNIPISGYLSMNMGGIRIMNDAIGGVTLTAIQDVSDLKAGEQVTLTGDQAYLYLRERDCEVFDSATDRLSREMQYLSEFILQAKAYTRGSTSEAMKIYDKVEPYLVTSIDFAKLLDEVNAYGFDPNTMLSVPGQTEVTAYYEEYVVDDDAFYEMVIDIFYEEVQ